MKNNQKGFAQVLIVIAVIAVLAIFGYFFFVQKGNLSTNSTNNYVPAIQSGSDLNTAANDLDNTDTTQVNTQLDQLNSDASAF